MTLTVTLYWSFRSPYSYIVLPRIADMARTFDVEIDLRVVHPAAIRNPSYFARMDPIARPYFLKDTARAAAFHGLPFRRPIPDPIVQDQTTFRLAEDHPLARRLGHLGIAATEGGRVLNSRKRLQRCFGMAQSLVGTKVAILPTPPGAQGSILRIWTPQSKMRRRRLRQS